MQNKRGTGPLRTVVKKSSYRRSRSIRRILSITLLVFTLFLFLLVSGFINPSEILSNSPIAKLLQASGTLQSGANESDEMAGTASETSKAGNPSSTILQDRGQNAELQIPAPDEALEPVPTSTPEPTPAPTPTPEPTPAPIIRAPGHENMPTFGSVEPRGDVGELEQLVRDKIASFTGVYGVTFVNLATGERFGVNDTQPYKAASTAKLPMNVLLWRRIAAGEIDPEAILTYKEEDFEPGTGIIQNQPFGTEYTVRQTSRYSIIHSDNSGINMIIRLLDRDKILEYMREIGFAIDYGARHRSSPSDMANAAIDLYKFYYEQPEFAGELIYNLENTDWRDRISAKLPPEIKVAHKIGNQLRTSNDVGIIFASQPYVLSVMTADTEHGVAIVNIANLSRMIYDFLEAPR